jgi:CelD/BcsL family acetyltransferase involved in cellulose biosynthesis
MAVQLAPPTADAVQAHDPRWLRFLQSDPEATVFHHPAWSQVLADAYGYRPLLLAQTDPDGEIVAGLPLVEHRALGGRDLIGLPFTDYCPPLARSAGDLAALSTSLVAWRRLGRVRTIAVHGPLPVGPGIHLTQRGVRHILPLRPGSREVLDRLRGGPLDRAARKAQRAGVEVRISRSAADLEPFYRLHLQTRRRLGVPVQPKRFIEALWRQVIGAGLGFVVFAVQADRPIAAALFLAWNGTLIYKFGASDSRSWALRPNNLVFWTAIEWACQQQYRQVDFGRTDVENQGLRDFKTRWGAIEVPLVYAHIASAPLRSRSSLPLRVLSTVIRSTPPIVCRAVGELVYRHVPAGAG